MQENIEEIKKKILEFGLRAIDEYRQENIPALTGERADNYKSLLSGYSSMLEERLGELEVLEAEFMFANRDSYKSNADCKTYFNGSQSGLELIKLKRLLKAVDKIVSACSSRLRRLEQEARNQQ